MAKGKRSTILVKGTNITIISGHRFDLISLTDMVQHFDGGGALIEQWLKNKDTVLFLGVWEQLNNPEFNSLEFEGIKNEAGRNSFYLSVKKWISTTNARGLVASAGRYGGTYAHKDLAFEFGSWLSPEFKLYPSAFVGVSVRQCGKGSTNERSEKLNIRKPPVLVGILQQQAYWANNRGETN